MENARLVAKAKTALRVSSTAYDEQIDGLITAAKLDLGIAGVTLPEAIDSLSRQAVKLYVKAYFRITEDHDRLVAAYEKLKASLQMSTGHTDWRDGA